MSERTRMRRTDAIMASGLMGLMLVADLAAFLLFNDRGPNLWFGVSIMPGTMAMIWLCFAGSIALVFNRPSTRGTREAEVGAAFFGKTLVVVGVTLTVAHLALLAFFGGLVGPDRNDLILRAFFCAMGLNLAFMFNAMPKIMDPKRMRVAGNPRLIGRVGVVCSLLMAVVGLVGEPGKIGPVFLTLAFTPPVFIVFSTLTTRRRKPG